MMVNTWWNIMENVVWKFMVNPDIKCSNMMVNDGLSMTILEYLLDEWWLMILNDDEWWIIVIKTQAVND